MTELQRATLTAMGNTRGCHPDCACCRSMPLMAGRHRHATPTVSAGVWQLPCELRLLHPPPSRRIHGRSIMIRRSTALALIWLAAAAPGRDGAVAGDASRTAGDSAVGDCARCCRARRPSGGRRLQHRLNDESCQPDGCDVPSAAGERAGRPARRGNARALLRSRHHERRLVRHAGRVGDTGCSPRTSQRPYTLPGAGP